MPDRPDDKPALDEPPERTGEESETDATTQVLTLARPSELLPAEIRDVSFGFALGGYSRARVDAYVEDVKRIIAELEVRRSPENAVKLALDRVGEQTAAILQQARESAEELTAASVSESEHLARRARVEAEELMESAQSQSRTLLERSAAESEELIASAQARLEDLRAEIEDARAERRRVLAELRSTAAALDLFATEAERDKPPAPPSTPPEGGEEDRPTDVISAVEDEPEDGVADKRPREARGEPRPIRSVRAAHR